MKTYKVVMTGEFRAVAAVTAKDEEHAKQLAALVAGNQRMGTLPVVKIERFEVSIEREDTGGE